ncbi:hypothetical protein RSOL_197560 [Rhizoctonia solani AG-3 Rhs1AP]|uniref:DUF6589 domain-containing protein n=2 Tax=Rhizoctonia solani AG-3 TaxID=1086053 RepID=A0A074RI39_9AGAM|nr:hypothetical protein RSOL_197560 [Rhizoctonia solani AG-3 Rhs1AP]KEP45075.1 hypothetical protein V565_321890 [Rhizoctonia solani 123E]
MKAQRGDRHTVTDNATVMTVVAIPDVVKHIFMEDTPSVNPTSETPPAAMEASIPPGLSWDDFSDIDRYKRLAAYNVYFIIDILFKTVPGLADLDIRNGKSLSAPPAPHIMPSGEDFKTLYPMLGITPVDETTIGGNLQVLGIMLQQQGLDSEFHQKILGLGKRKIPCVGDNMTTTRLEAARNLRIRDPNGYERLDWLVIVPGWFHILLNLGMATFDSHRGGDKTMSFIRDITLLGRTGLTMNMRKKRPDFFAMDEFLRHKLFALVRSLWMHYSSAENLDDLVTWVKSAPESTLRENALRIHQERMSSEALEILSESNETDEVLTNTILQSRDLLQFYSTRRAIQTGNVGLLEDLLPRLLIYFKGHDNHNYAQGLAECMHWMRYDAPPGMSWQAHAEVSPAIPILGQLAEKVEDRLIQLKRTRVHKEIGAELDISRLATRHMAHQIHQLHPDRILDEPKDKAKDYVYLGEEPLMDTKWLDNLNKARQDFRSIKSTKQEYRPTETQEE